MITVRTVVEDQTMNRSQDFFSNDCKGTSKVPEQDKEQNSLMIVKGFNHLRRDIKPQIAAWTII